MAGAYPAAIRGELDQGTNRFLPLVKWLLVFPHYFVLIFLSIVAQVVFLIAFAAILFTGRYPRALFDFMEGVMRWGWRATFYAMVLGTDKYPPFRLEADAAYPADLTVEYPDRLSRLLLILKWPWWVWLVLFPHLVILTVFGWVQMLLLLAVILVKLFTGRYPVGLYEFIMGTHRWGVRVAAYANLMTDSYPPFRLADDGAGSAVQASGAAGGPPSTS